MPTSDDFFDIMRQCWEQSIPPQFRARDELKEWRGGAGQQPSALCANVPKSSCMNDRYFDKLAMIPRHMSRDQRAATARQEAIAAKRAERKAAADANKERTANEAA